MPRSSAASPPGRSGNRKGSSRRSSASGSPTTRRRLSSARRVRSATGAAAAEHNTVDRGSHRTMSQVGPRPAPTLSVAFRLISWDRSTGVREIATDNPGAFTPGALLDGAPIEEVVIDVGHDETRLRVRTSGDSSTLRGLIARIVRRELAKLGVLTATEYRVVRQSGAFVDL